MYHMFFIDEFLIILHMIVFDICPIQDGYFHISFLTLTLQMPFPYI